MEASAFDELSVVYDAMVNWDKRLANEGPFFRRWFERVGARRVADVACGTGRHAALFAEWGLEVHASDISAEMIARARALHPEATVHWALRRFDQPLARDETYDAIICVGNSLALVADEAAVGAALTHMLDAVRPGGVVITHVLNVWKLPDGPIVWQKHLRRELARGPVLINKGVHRAGRRAYVDLLVLEEKSAAPIRAESVQFLGLADERLTAAAQAAGAGEVHLFGNHAEAAYRAEESTDLIMVAQKA